MTLKGKEIAGKSSASKRKRNDNDKSGGRKKKNSGVLQFFDVSADVDESEDEMDDGDFDRDFMDGLNAELKDKNESGKAHHIPFLPKEEELSEEEIERLLEERYRPGSRNVVYAEDEYETKRSGDGDFLIPSLNDPIIWRVKCMVGRERQIVCCLIQKYIDLHSLGNKLKIVSAFALEHTKGYIYIEADKECDVLEACKGLCSIYSSRMLRVPKNEVSHLFTFRNTLTELLEGTWVRMKYGKYKGDLAQVVAVDNAKKKTTVKLIPRIDLQAMAKKLAGGATVKQTDVPTPRLISSTELEDFKPYIQYKRDRQTGKVFETIDGLMLKDGYLYKKISIESLTYSDVLPSADELQKFRTCDKDASDDMEWLSHLYGEQRKKRQLESSKGSTEGSTKGSTKGLTKGSTKGLEGKSGTKKGDGFQLHDLVLFGRKDFGVIIGVEDDNFQVLKENVDGVEVLTVELHELKNGSLDKKFTALDKNMMTVSVNDTVRVLEGPFKDKKGVARQIYRGTIFIYDENQLENGGYYCAKAQLCENASHSNGAHHENIGDESGPPGFEDSTSPKSPQLPNKPWQAKESSRDSNGNHQGDRDGNFSIGQTLRIRVGPLKGYLCRVTAVYRSEVTVKLDSQMKVIKVKREHLSEAGVKSIWGPDSNGSKPFDGFGTQESSRDLGGSGTLAGGSGWNSGEPSTGRSSWPDFPASDFLLDSSFSNPFGSLVSNDSEKGKDGDDPWGTKATSKKSTDTWDKGIGPGGDWKSSWSKTSEDKTVDAKLDQDNWGKSADGWNRCTANNTGYGNSVKNSWEAEKIPRGHQEGCSNDATGSWDTLKSTSNDERPDQESRNQIEDWNAQASRESIPTWDKGKGVRNETAAWGIAVATQGKENTAKLNEEDSWGKAAESRKAKVGSSINKSDCWNCATVATQGNQTGGWGNSAGSWTQTESACGDRVSSWNNTEGGSGSQPGKWGNAKDITKGEGATAATQGNQTGGWGNSAGSWTQTESARGDRVSSWNNTEGASGSQPGKWGNAKDITEGEGADGSSAWTKGTATNTDGGWNRSKVGDSDQEFGWNKGRMGNKEASGDRDQQDNWGRPRSFDGGRGSGGRRGRGGFRGGNRDNFNGGRSFGRGQSSGWSKDHEHRWTGDGDRQSRQDNGTQNAGGNRNQGDGWGKSRFSADSGSGWSKGRAAEHQDGDKGFTGNNSSGQNNEGSNWSASKDLGGNQSSGWSKELMTKEAAGASRDQEHVWKNSEALGEDHGAGCKTGTNKTGGSQSSGWDTKASNWNNTEGNRSSGWSKELVTKEAAGASRDQEHVWKNSKASGEDQGAGWKSGTNKTGGSQSSDWDTKASNLNNTEGNRSSGWNQGLTANEETGGSREQGYDWNKRKASGEDQGSRWNDRKSDTGGKQSSDWDGKANNWNNPKGNHSSGWSPGFSANEETGGNIAHGGSRKKASGEDQSSSWKSGTNDAGGNQLSGWDSRNISNTPKDSSGQSSTWDKGFSANDAVGNQSSGWDSKNISNPPKDSSGQSSAWDKGFSAKDAGGTMNQEHVWNRRKASDGGGDQTTGWNSGDSFGGDRSSSWSKVPNTADGSEDRSTSWNRTFGNRDMGDNWRGGNSFGGGRSSGWNRGPPADGDAGDPADLSNRPRGFSRGQSFGSNRGGFGNRGRGRRDQSGGWNRGKAQGEDQSFGWSKGRTDNADWGSNDRAGSWSQGGRGKGQWQNWNKESGSTKETGGTSSQVSGWNNQGSGWKQSQVAKESDGWNHGTASTKEVGGSSGGTDGWNCQGSDWSIGAGLAKVGETKDQTDNWNQSCTPDGSHGWRNGTDSHKEAFGISDTASGWKKEGSLKEAAGSNNGAGGLNSSQGSGNWGTVTRDGSDGWNQPNAAGGPQSSGWNNPMGAKEKGVSWGQPPANPWDKEKDGCGGRGGW